VKTKASRISAQPDISTRETTVPASITTATNPAKMRKTVGWRFRMLSVAASGFGESEISAIREGYRAAADAGKAVPPALKDSGDG